jgi:pyruvate,water dikinase
MAMKSIVSSGSKNQQELTGKSVYGGFVRGKAHVILEKGEVHKFKRGEVLVTAMTDINFASAVRKAGAIVTEKGGVTCHAATVARELRKPCLVSVKSVTKFVKTGDEVIVDATGGVIKIVD